MKSLWSSDIARGADQTPLTMLVEQANALTNATNGTIVGKVATFSPQYDSPPPPQLFRYELNLIVENLDYSFTILELRHEITGYPAYISPFSKIAEEVGLNKQSYDGKYNETFVATNDFEMESGLGLILGSKTATNIIKTLLKQSTHFPEKPPF